MGKYNKALRQCEPGRGLLWLGWWESWSQKSEAELRSQCRKETRLEDLKVSSFEGERTASAKALGWDQAQCVSRIKIPVKRGKCGREEGWDSVGPWETHHTGCCKGGSEYRSPAGISILLIGIFSQKPISWRWTPDVNNEDWKLLFHAESSFSTSVFSL